VSLADFLSGWRAAVFVIAIVMAVYGVTVTYEFLRWDDYLVIINNAAVTHGLLGRIWTASQDGLYVPVTYSMWAFLWQCGKGLPWIFHAANVCLHAFNAAMVFHIGVLIQQRIGKTSPAAALLGAAVFAVHPLQAEPVAWVTCLRDLMAAAFVLAALVLLLQDVSVRGSAAATALFALALLSKPTVATAPAAFGLIILMGSSPQNSWRRLTVVGLWLLPALAAVVVNKAIQQRSAELMSVGKPFLQRLWVAGDSLCFYAAKLAFPSPLATDYGRTPDYALATTPSLVGCGVLVCACIGSGWLASIGRWSTACLIGATVLFALPTLGLIPFQAQAISTVADRYMYLPLACVGWMIAIVAAGARPVTRYVCALVVCGLAVMVIARIPVWRNNDALFGDMIVKNAKSVSGLVNLAVEHKFRGNLPDAERLYRRALLVAPRDPYVVAGLLDIMMAEGRGDAAAAEWLPVVGDQAFAAQREWASSQVELSYRLAARLCWQRMEWHKAYTFYQETRTSGRGEVPAAIRQEFDAFLIDAHRHGVDVRSQEGGDGDTTVGADGLDR